MSNFEILGTEGFQRPRLLGEAAARPADGGEDGPEFAAHLTDALGKVGELREDVKDKAEALARGEPVALHDLMISMGKSEVAFNLMVEVRNRLLDAWQTLSRS